jgi:hypothetical protein
MAAFRYQTVSAVSYHMKEPITSGCMLRRVRPRESCLNIQTVRKCSESYELGIYTYQLLGLVNRSTP